jgi:photosystem II stability/assembly factor-like uncharacterized protein
MMEKRVIALFLGLTCGLMAAAQAFTYTWTATNSPNSSYRFDDIYFLNPDTGFAVNYPNGTHDGYVARTYDGGNNWTKVWDSTGITYRDICFADAMHGWIGTLETGHNPGDTTILYQTTDGGTTWAPVPNLPGPRPAGICGMNHVTDSIIVAVGRYPGPAGFYKTVDQGVSWSYVNLDSLAGGLVDVYFVNPDTGFAAGTSGNYFTGNGRVLMTVDGGATWRIVYTSAHTHEICWKISYPSRQIGYISLEAFANSGAQYFLKTTDGGLTWQDINISLGGGPSGSYDVEGMGFINDSTGWIGGDVSTYFTQDGGTTWVQQTWGNRINRFRFLNDSVAFAGGQKVYALSRIITGTDAPRAYAANLGQNFPNPFQDHTVIEYFVPEAGRVHLQVYDVLGQSVAVLVDEEVPAGNHRLMYDAAVLPDGVYFYTMIIGDRRATKRMLVRR